MSNRIFPHDYKSACREIARLRAALQSANEQGYKLKRDLTNLEQERAAERQLQWRDANRRAWGTVN